MKVKTAYFEIVNACNLNCVTCYNRSGQDKRRMEISPNQLRDSIRILLPLGLQRVLISGGEPLLHSDINGILSLINEFSELSFGITTNGTVYNRQLFDILNKIDNFTLQVSLDGSCEDVNARIRGENSFSQVMEFLKKVNKVGPKSILKMVLTQDNIEDTEPFFRLAASVGFIPEFAFVYRSGNSSDNWECKALTAQQKLRIMRLVDRLNKELSMKSPLPDCTEKCPYVKNAEEMSVCIKTDGSIQPCQSLYDGAYTLGNIFDFDMEYFGKKVDDFISLARKRAEHDMNCRTCMLKDTCEKGCLAAAVNLNGNPLGSDGECEYRKLKILSRFKI